MAIKVIAQRRDVKLGKNPGKKFVMRPDLYIPIQEKKVFAEASTHSGISAGVIKEVIRTWATEGHSVPLPGLGTMRFGVRSKAVENLEDVKTNLISVRRIIFTPNVDVKDELKNTSIQITCLDEDGNVLKRVTSGDSGEIEDNENGSENGSENGGSNSGSVTQSVSAPTFSGATQFTESTQVTMSGPAGASIFYTVDGSTPTDQSLEYEEPITLSATTTVKAIAIKDGISSAVTSRTYSKVEGGDDEPGGDDH